LFIFSVLPENDEQSTTQDDGMSLLGSAREKQQLMREKRKRPIAEDGEEVERRASKGRRIRYVEIPKLVNFFPATPERITWNHERRTDLFKSLFS
jgi:hypothetical protein